MTATANRRRGAKFELDVLEYARSLSFDAERLRLAGRLDQGDVAIRDAGIVYVVEAKAAAKYDLSGWVAEAQAEARNYALARGLAPDATWPVVVVKRRMKPISESFVVTTLADLLDP
jgi:hypothetical protein